MPKSPAIAIPPTGRLLALDVGKKRVGIAVTDPTRTIAQGLTTCPAHELMAFLTDYTRKEPVALFVVGKPTTLAGNDSEAMVFAQSVINGLEKRFQTIPIVLHDERFTSRLAEQSILAGGVPKMKRRDKALVDMVSATIILQSYLEAQDLQKR